MVFGGWCDGEGPRAAAQVYNPRANTWTLWTEAGAQAQQPALEWTELMKESGITDVTDMTSLTNAQPVPGLQSSVNSALQTVGALTALRSSLPPDGLDMPIDKDLSIMENTGSLIGNTAESLCWMCVDWNQSLLGWRFRRDQRTEVHSVLRF
ncbi:hypothetical protein CSKR_203880 [Clonorchis sinensis]|uniref:Uncharacterized protein n=1 Tax=Clonorchis sinensis TaxID=79923 RepID=A0A8T1N0W5_CLOSI|nr:hypothetical protein CSKR_203880 [Clonorchis sinensis]